MKCCENGTWMFECRTLTSPLYMKSSLRQVYELFYFVADVAKKHAGAFFYHKFT